MEPMPPADRLSIEPAPKGTPHLGSLRLGVQLLHGVALFAGVVALIYLAFVFKFLTDGVAIALGHTAGAGALAPLVLASLGSWSVMYLLHDHLGILGSATMRQRLIPQLTDAPLSQHFVELRPRSRHSELRPDWGWLLLFPDRLEFQGERQIIRIAKTELPQPPTRERSLGGILPTWLELPVRAPWKGLSLLSRERARTLSGTAEDTETLRLVLTGWLAGSAQEGYNTPSP